MNNYYKDWGNYFSGYLGYSIGYKILRFEETKNNFLFLPISFGLQAGLKFQFTNYMGGFTEFRLGGGQLLNLGLTLRIPVS